jgi:hypothetical protein
MNSGIPQESLTEKLMQNEFFDLLDKYGNLPEPLENWTTEDLIRLMDAIDMELQNRAPPDSVDG